MDKLDRIGHLVLAALAKIRELNTYPLAEKTKQRLAELTKEMGKNQKNLQAFVDVHRSNGKLDQETLDRSLDLMLQAAQDINRELEMLLAKAKGE